MKKRYRNIVLILTFFTMIIFMSAVCVLAEDLNEGKMASCTLNGANDHKAVYQFTPKKSGPYLFFSSGAKERVIGRLYNPGEDASGEYSYRDAGYGDTYDPDFMFLSELTAGETYTLSVDFIDSAASDGTFDIGAFIGESGKMMMSTTEVELTDSSNLYKVIAFFGGDLQDADWISSDESVVGWDSCSSWRERNYKTDSFYEIRTVTLKAHKNGTATMSYIDKKSGEVYGSINVTCKDMTEYYGLSVGGVQVSNRNASAITGQGISGKVTYDKASNTLSLENATLTAAMETSGITASRNGENQSYSKAVFRAKGYGNDEWGTFSGVINNHIADTLRIKLTGTNKINNVEFVEQDSDDEDYDSSEFYTGIGGINSCSTIVFEGTGSLSIDSSNIGTAVFSSGDVSIAEGASLDIRATNNNNANGIDAAGAVNVNGKLKTDVETRLFVADGKKACVTGYGIKAGTFTVGSKGSAVLNAATDCDTTSYCIMLYSGGGATISGTLNAKATGASGKSAGVAIGGDYGEASLRISGSGTATLQGNYSAVDSISFEAPILIKAGSSASDVRTIHPSQYNGETYVIASAPGSCSAGHKLVKVAAKDSTEDETGNIEYWFCSECGKVFGDSSGKKEISIEDTVIPRKPGQDESLFLVSPDNNNSYNVGDTINISAYSNVFIFTYISGIPIEGAPNRIYVKILKDGQEVENKTLLYYSAGESVSTDYKADVAGRYTILISKYSDFSTLRSAEVQVGKPNDRTGQTGSDGTALGSGASKEAAEAAIAAMTSDNDLPGSVFRKLQLKSTKQTSKSITITWKKASGATKYVIYGNKCGKANKMQKLAESTGKSKTFKKVLGKNVKKGTYYKFMIVALDKNSNVVSSSRIIHVAAKGGKVGNPGKVTTKAKKNKVSIRKGKTFKLAGKQVAASKKLKVKEHRKVAYESTNTKIATVSGKGVIKGKKKGTCYVYAYAQNGVFSKIKVTVK